MTHKNIVNEFVSILIIRTLESFLSIEFIDNYVTHLGANTYKQGVDISYRMRVVINKRLHKSSFVLFTRKIIFCRK